MWRYAGHVLGIDEALLFPTLDEQRAFFYASVKHQGRPERIPPETKTLLDGVARNATQGAPVLYRPLQALLHQSCRWLSGDEYVSGMQIENAGNTHWSLLAIRAAGTVGGAIWRSPGGRTLLATTGKRIYQQWGRRARKRRDRVGEYRVRVEAR
jgi:hypothetical protein